MPELSAVRVILVTLSAAVASFAFMTLIAAFAKTMVKQTISVLFLHKAASFIAGLLLIAALALTLLLPMSTNTLYLSFAISILGILLVHIFVGLTAISVIIGWKVFQMGDNQGTFVGNYNFLHLFIGVLILGVASFVPILGWMLLSFAVITGVGATALVIMSNYRSKKNLPSTEPEKLLKWKNRNIESKAKVAR